MESVLETNPELQQSTEFMTALGEIDGAIDGVKQLQEELAQLAGAADLLQQEVVAPFQELNAGFAKRLPGRNN